jgi:hypothetical protein
MLWPMATTDYLRRTGGVTAAGWRRADSWWTHIYWESTDMQTLVLHILAYRFRVNTRVRHYPFFQL